MNDVDLDSTAPAAILRPLVDAWDEVAATYGMHRLRAAAAVELAVWAISRTLGWMVCVEVSDEYGVKTGVWQTATEDIQNEALSDIACTDYACGSNGWRDRAMCVRVRPAHYRAIINTVKAFSEQDGQTSTSSPAERYPQELRAAIEAFEAVSRDAAATAKQGPKAALSAWLAEHKPELSANAHERIATVANWQPKGGAPKTPG